MTPPPPIAMISDPTRSFVPGATSRTVVVAVAMACPPSPAVTAARGVLCFTGIARSRHRRGLEGARRRLLRSLHTGLEEPCRGPSRDPLENGRAARTVRAPRLRPFVRLPLE